MPLLRHLVCYRILKENWKRMCLDMTCSPIIPPWLCQLCPTLAPFFLSSYIWPRCFHSSFSLNRSDWATNEITQPWGASSRWALLIRCVDSGLSLPDSLLLVPDNLPCYLRPLGAQGPNIHFCDPSAWNGTETESVLHKYLFNESTGFIFSRDIEQSALLVGSRKR